MGELPLEAHGGKPHSLAGTPGAGALSDPAHVCELWWAQGTCLQLESSQKLSWRQA